jgi:hypothetical protein
VWEWFLYCLVLERTKLTYKILTSFMASFDLIPIVLVPENMFLLCHILIRSFLAFGDQISILIVGCVTIWSQGLHQWCVYPENTKVLLLFLGFGQKIQIQQEYIYVDACWKVSMQILILWCDVSKKLLFLSHLNNLNMSYSYAHMFFKCLPLVCL